MMPNRREAGGRARSFRLVAALTLAVALAGAWLAPPPATAQEQGQVDVVLEGKGWGHGVGMAQDGALAMGAAGSSAEEILAAFYPGTSLGEAGGSIEVSITSLPAAEIGFPSGGQIVDTLSGEPSPGFPVTVQPGGSVAVSGDGGLFRVVPLAGAEPEPLPPPPPTTTVPNAPTVPPTVAPALEPTSSGPLWAVPSGEATTEVGGSGQYRGILRMEGGDGGVQIVNRVDVEDYLRGMGEIRDPGWPAASLQAQAIAARTYAVRSIRSGSVLCPDDRCQVYLGATAEYSAMDSAVAATAGQVLLYDGSLALSVYSASGGGISATAAEGFGDSSGEYPYLVSAPYPTHDPLPWNLRAPLAEMAARFGYPGSATGAHVTRTGPSGRALDITFEGDTGPMVVDSQRFNHVLSLRSNLYTLRIDAPPPPPPPAEPPAPGEPTAGGRQVQIASPPAIAYSEPSPVNRRPWIALALVLFVGASSVVIRAWRPAPVEAGSERPDT